MYVKNFVNRAPQAYSSAGLVVNLIEYLEEFVKLFKLPTLLLLDAVAQSIQPREPAVLQRIEGNVASAPRKSVCVFAHYDRDGLIDDYVVYYLAKLEALSCEIIFVSTARISDNTQIERIRPYCKTIIVRENLGYDFGSWKTGIAEISDWSRYDRLIIANDSVYGPVFDFEEDFLHSGHDGADFWGITDARTFRHHLQSYFLVFERPVLENPIFQSFWRELPNYRFKFLIIQACEIGLSRRLVRAGLKFRAMYPYEKIRMRSLANRESGKSRRFLRRRANPTLLFWDILLEDFQCPFLKVNLIRNNPAKLQNVNRWRDIISDRSNYDCDLIGRHLARITSR